MAENKRRRAESAADSETRNQTAGSLSELALQTALRFRRFAGDIAGVFLLALALMILLALLGWTGGALLDPLAILMRRWLGWGSGLMVVTLAVLGLILINPRTRHLESVRWARILGLEGAAFAALALLSIMGGASLIRAEAGLDGGLIGWGLAEFAGLLVGPFWRIVLLVVLFVTGLLGGLGLGGRLQGWIVRRLEASPAASDLPRPEEVTPGAVSAVQTAPLPRESKATLQLDKKKKGRAARLPPEFKKRLRVQSQDQVQTEPPPRDERLPPLELLSSDKNVQPDERNINQTAGLIEKTLSEFGIPAKVVGFQVGPTVTQFALEPGFVERPGAEGESGRQKVRVSQISALSRDLSLALSAQRLRIQAPVPGRPYVGIEVPNPRATTVRLRSILESEAFFKINSPLALALGRDVSGQPVVADLAAMPHLLIAGATGTGKSVCIAALTACLAFNNSPEDLRLVMADPKMVELVRFNGLPHLYGMVETEMERILSVLRWTVMEMDNRYKLLEEARARDIDSYNRKMRRRKDGETLPRLVVFIDELADLMMTAAEQTEHTLVRLAQMARATGIHLVLATQRPSTDVVTGLIKANFPARLSFGVASSVDSRVILDTPGAESLLGRGDMLFLPPEAANPRRAQGVLVSDQEIEALIEYWKKLSSPAEGEPEPPWEAVIAEDAAQAERDEMLERAVQIVQQSGRASASMLQRRLRIGYPRAARLVDQLEKMGIVGPSQGPGREREVFDESGEDNWD